MTLQLHYEYELIDALADTLESMTDAFCEVEGLEEDDQDLIQTARELLVHARKDHERRLLQNASKYGVGTIN